MDDTTRRAEELSTRHRISLELARRALGLHEETGQSVPDILLELRSEDSPPPASLGKYRVMNKLGEGGQGTVYQVFNPGLERVEAMKILREAVSPDSEDYKRFAREARVLAQLHHPNVVPVYDVGVLDGRPFYTMEYLQGESVAEVLKRMGRLPVRAAVKIARDAARGLQAAHEQGIVHRDIKPHNLLVLRDKEDPLQEHHRSDESLTFSTGHAARFRVLVADFGLARIRGEQSLTAESGVILGTAAFMPPEQANAERRAVNERSDVYSLGASLYNMVTGIRPLEAETVMDLLVKVNVEEPLPPRSVVPGISRDLETIILKCLSKDPARRYAGAGPLADDLDRWLRGEVILARPVSPWYRLYRKARRHRALIAGLLASAFVTAGLAFLFAVLPGLRRASEDRAALRKALVEKAGRERRFRALLERRKFDEAIELARPLFGRSPSPAKLHHPERAEEEEFSELKRPYRLDLPRAYLLRGRRRLQEGSPLGREDLANAYRTGRERREYQKVAHAALVELGSHLLRSEELTAAENVSRLCAVRFGARTPSARALLARTLLRTGKLEEAAGYWHTLESDPTYEREARQALRLLRRLLPRVHLPLSPGLLVSADLDGDGKVELVHAALDWTLRVLRPTSSGWEVLSTLPLLSGPGRAIPDILRVLDSDGDGRPEIVVAGGDPESTSGSLFVIEWKGNALRLAARTETPAHCHDVQAGDVDQDGKIELVVALGYFTRALAFYRFEPSGLRLLHAWPVLCDPLLVRILKGGRVLLWLGPWSVSVARPLVWRWGDSRAHFDKDRGSPLPWGFRFVVLGPDGTGRFREVAACPDRMGRGRATLSADGGSLLVAVRHKAQERKVLRDLVQPGLYRIELQPDRLGRAKRLAGGWADSASLCAPVPLRLGKRECAAWTVDEDLWVVGMNGEERSVVRLGRKGRLETSELDGDRSSEIVLYNDAGKGSILFGLGPYVTPARPKIRLLEAGTEGEVSPEEELLSAGLYREAAAACRERLHTHEEVWTRYRLGLALAGRGDWRGAAAAFGRAARDRRLAPEALMRRAQALERAREWGELTRCLELLLDQASGDPFLKTWTESRLDWARPAAMMAPRLLWERWREESSLVCENPFKVRTTSDTLEVWSSDDSKGDIAGPLFYYEEGPLRLRFRFRTEGIAWETFLSLGIQAAETIGDADPEYRGTSLSFRLAGEGATDAPVLQSTFHFHTRDGKGRRAQVPEDTFVPAAGETYTAVLEYVAGLNRAFFELRDSRDRVVLGPLSLDLPAPLERGLYFAGWVGLRRTGAGSGEFASRTLLRSIHVDGIETGLRPAEWKPRASREWLAAANAALVQGRLAASEKAFEEARTRSAGDRDLLGRIHLFRSLLHLRKGNRETASKDVRSALAFSPAFVRKTLESQYRRVGRRLSPLALSREEFAILWDAALGD